MACLDRNTDVTAVSTQVPVIRLTHGVESCFFHDSITVLITIVCFQPNHYLRKLISKVNPSFKVWYCRPEGNILSWSNHCKTTMLTDPILKLRG